MAPTTVSINEETAEIAGLGVQGPTSHSVLRNMGLPAVDALKPFGLLHAPFDGTSAAGSPVCKQNIALGSVMVPYGEVGSTLWVEIYYQREMHWSRTMARAEVVSKPFRDPPRRHATPPAAF